MMTAKSAYAEEGDDVEVLVGSYVRAAVVEGARSL
jgi:hypothetical protein